MSVDHTAVRLARKVVEAIAAFILVAQPLPVLAGEVIQGVPRVADGDTLQVLTEAHCLQSLCFPAML